MTTKRIGHGDISIGSSGVWLSLEIPLTRIAEIMKSVVEAALPAACTPEEI